MMTSHELDTILDDARDDFRGVMNRLHRHILEAAAAALDEAWEQDQEKEQEKQQQQRQRQDRVDAAEAQLPLFPHFPAPHPGLPPLSLAAFLSGQPPAGGVDGGAGAGIGSGVGTGSGMDAIPTPVPMPLPAFAPATMADFLPGAPPAKPARPRTSARASKGPKVMVTAKITLDLSQSPPSWRIEASVGTRRRAQGKVRH